MFSSSLTLDFPRSLHHRFSQRIYFYCTCLALLVGASTFHFCLVFEIIKVRQHILDRRRHCSKESCHASNHLFASSSLHFDRFVLSVFFQHFASHHSHGHSFVRFDHCSVAPSANDFAMLKQSHQQSWHHAHRQ